MKRAGTVVGAAGGVIVVRSPDDSYPRVGSELLDEHLERVGEVVDVFGPVERPYLAVAPREEGRRVRLVGSDLYVK